MPTDKNFFLRIGSNSEKKYIQKAGPLFSGFIVRANYFESAPGMLSGIFLNFNKEKINKGFIIDPVTYVFGLNPEDEGQIKSWVKVKKDKAEDKIKDGYNIPDNSPIPEAFIRKIPNPKKGQENKVEINIPKRAYKKLAQQYFSSEHLTQVGIRALNPKDFEIVDLEKLTKSVVNYQINALESHYNITDYKEFKDNIPKPLLILSPYFLISNDNWLEMMENIWKIFDDLYTGSNGAIVIQCKKEDFCKYKDNLLKIIKNLNTNNIFLWIDGFEEHTSSEEVLRSYVDFIVKLNLLGKQVINLYGGGFSFFLYPFGLAGIINGPGYGMERKIEPIEGGQPTAKFYIPKLHIRTQVGKAHDIIVRNELGNTQADYLKDICNCPICKDGIHNIEDLIIFYAELGKPMPCSDGSTRRYPTQESLERCNYHFMLSRLIEFKWALNASREESIAKLASEKKLWRTDKNHLDRWYEILSTIK